MKAVTLYKKADGSVQVADNHNSNPSEQIRAAKKLRREGLPEGVEEAFVVSLSNPLVKLNKRKIEANKPKQAAKKAAKKVAK